MSHLFDETIVKAFSATISEVAKTALPAAVQDVLATPRLSDHLARTIEREVEQFAETELGVPPSLRFTDEFAFFDDYLRYAYESTGMSQKWCSRWWAHGSVRFRIRSMWLAYEALARKEPATCDELFLRTIGDHHMTLLTGEGSPMRACDTNHQPGKPLKSDPVEGGAS
ncbi:DUF4913 domain-containing protein [Hoyosella subflava]|uniref:Uncharacterized protein n=1 Tax=Hoyosella subflava (strain DSM 45089 / JCM 17490 / NBRC 109087 / DQS3-9A1) TaxID=443218 RepID=F6EL36_HOYSD|nr:DUF4913 domain-containing protein [Hoyosella subflava]AEF42699.1 hypothetical protein AS9A_4266 [Hoyosella subflava DQS3-9A1]